MEYDFWDEAWARNQIGFHQNEINKNLLKFKKYLEAEDKKILVPLCGKTKDMNFLIKSNFHVTGVEIVGKAILDYFNENKIDNFTKDEIGNFCVYSNPVISLYHGDFFKFQNINQKFSAIYDRASLIALPSEMRKMHAKTLLNVTKKNARILMISLEYDQSKVEGPPHSVTKDEIEELFSSNFEIEILRTESTRNIGRKFKDNNIDSLKQTVYLLTKKC